MKKLLFISVALCAFALFYQALTPCAETPSNVDAYQNAVVEDWTRQERDLGREIGSQEALDALVARTEAFIEWLRDEDWSDDKTIDALSKECNDAKSFLLSKETRSEQETRERYLALRAKARDAALANPSVSERPIVFLQEERFTWQMLHEYLSYYYNACGMRGGGVYVLKSPGKSFDVESLTDGLFPRGVFQTLSLSYDAKTIYFSFADFSKTQPEDMPKTNVEELMKRPYMEDFSSNYMKIEDGKFHLYKMTLADRAVEQLTTGCEDDFDPVEAPDGSVVFMSTRRGGYGRCHGHYEPLNVHTLHRLNPDKSVATLSYHETNEWQPSFMQDGRILYTRWDYVDRAASKHHGLWTTNPDGTNSASLFGNYTFEVNACYQAKEVPNSNKIMFIGGAHHLDVGGTVLLFDPSKARYDEKTGQDDLQSIERLTPNIPCPEVDTTGNQVCQQYFFSPYPLSEDAWLASYSHDPLGGYLGGTKSCGKLGLYYADRFGNLELLYQNDENDESCLYPLPLVEREKPAVRPTSIPNDADENVGTFVLSNVYESLMPLPKDRKVKELRVVQLLPKAPDYQSDRPRIGQPGSANARMVLGTVPVEEDGSAHFQAPAKVPLYFQALDESGRAVQSMRSIVYLQPGENRGCVGCHEQTQTTLANANEKRALASLREPSTIAPADEDLRPISYPRFIQPILDRNCVSCHDGSEDSHTPTLTGEIQPPYTKSYAQLVPYLKWYEWGGNTYREIVTIPGECGADISPLSSIINDETHAKIGLSDDDRRKLYLWMDINVPFYGVYEPGEQAKQLNGKKVEEPKLQ